MRYFVVVAEELHFGRAAERLHMAQSPLSRQIRQLERDLGVELIDRAHHVVGLTDAGRTFLRSARVILNELDRATHQARRAARGEIGTLVIGYVSEVTADLLPRGLRSFKDRFPEVELELREGTTGEVLDWLRHLRIDVGFARAPGSAEDLDSEDLIEETFLLAVPSGHWAEAASCSLKDVADEPFVLASSLAQGLRREVESACRDAGFRPVAAREAESLTAILLLVAANLGIALVPASAASMYPVPGVRYVDLADPVPTTRAGIVWRPNEPSRLVAGFTEIVREEARRHKGETDVWPERKVVDVDTPDS